MMPNEDQAEAIKHLDREQTEQKEQDWLNDARKCRDSGCGSLNAEVGLGFSGGGVRSATFNLGVLQALASQDVLDKVGYISSVSGGSYINSWLAAWISKDRFQDVNRALADHEYKTQKSSPANSQEEAKNQYVLSDAEERYRAQRPIAHLRHYSSYLTPQKGILSSDVWTAVAAYLLRLAPNLLFVLLAATALIGLPYILANFYRMEVDKEGWQFFQNLCRSIFEIPHGVRKQRPLLSSIFFFPFSSSNLSSSSFFSFLFSFFSFCLFKNKKRKKKRKGRKKVP